MGLVATALALPNGCGVLHGMPLWMIYLRLTLWVLLGCIEAARSALKPCQVVSAADHWYLLFTPTWGLILGVVLLAHTLHQLVVALASPVSNRGAAANGSTGSSLSRSNRLTEQSIEPIELAERTRTPSPPYTFTTNEAIQTRGLGLSLVSPLRTGLAFSCAGSATTHPSAPGPNPRRRGHLSAPDATTLARLREHAFHTSNETV